MRALSWSPFVLVSLLAGLASLGCVQEPRHAALLASGAPEAANAAAQARLKKDSGDVEAWYSKALAASRLGRREEALEAAGHGLALAGKDAKLRMDFGSLAVALKERALLVKVYDSLRFQHPARAIELLKQPGVQGLLLPGDANLAVLDRAPEMQKGAPRKTPGGRLKADGVLSYQVVADPEGRPVAFRILEGESKLQYLAIFLAIQNRYILPPGGADAGFRTWKERLTLEVTQTTLTTMPSSPKGRR